MHFTLHLTRACNLRCSYCYAPPRPDLGMTLETARQVLDLGLRLNRGSCGLVFFGGEPLLKLDLIRQIVAETKTRQEKAAAASISRSPPMAYCWTMPSCNSPSRTTSSWP